MNALRKSVGMVLVVSGLWAATAGNALAFEGDVRDILKQGLLGAGVGAISAGSSGGKAGKGALIGAGTNVLGNLIFGLLSSPSRVQTAPVSYAAPVTYYEPAPTYVTPQPAPTQPAYYAPASTYTAAAPVYSAPVYASTPVSSPVSSGISDSNRQILKQGILGAGVGAIAAGSSKGKAGTGALIGAGTNVIGGALFDTIFSSPAPTAATTASAANYNSYPARSTSQVRRILRKFDENGKLISEEEFWD